MTSVHGQPDTFGAWVRKRRKLLDLTQDALAEQASLSASAIRKIESDGRRPSRETAELLAAALRVDHDEREHFLRMARSSGDASSDSSLAALSAVEEPAEHLVGNLAGNLAAGAVGANLETDSERAPKRAPEETHAGPVPSASSTAASEPLIVDTVTHRPLPTPPLPIIGRAQEIAQIRALFNDAQCRLLTIVGAGGMGKTRLALEIARRDAAKYSHGAIFVELSPLTSADYLPSAVASALGLASATQIDPGAAVIEYLAHRSLLLVLDSMEHLLSGAEFLGDLLAKSANVKLLVTSREHLNLSGEWVFELQGLPVRRGSLSGAAGTPESAASAQPGHSDGIQEESAAVMLFVQRAQQSDVTFQLDAERREAVHRICALLGGMPLAIELAASWVRVLSPNEILEEIARSIDFLAANRRDLPARHRSMRAVFDQSWALLGDREQRTLRRMSILRGSFSREAVRAVAEGSLSEISTLVAKSLLIHGAAAAGAAVAGGTSAGVRSSGTGRYRVHEIVRQFAREHLDLANEESATQQRLLDYLAEFAEAGYASAHGEGYVRWIEAMQTELDNLRLALEWGFAHDVQKALRLFCALRMLWEQRSADEASEWMSRAIDLCERTPDVPDDMRASVLGMAAWVDRDHRQAAQRAERALALARRVENARLVATVLPLLGHAAIREGRPREAAHYFDEALEIALRMNNGVLEASVRNEAGKADRYLGNYARAHAHHERARELARAAAHPALQAEASLNLNLIAMRTGDFTQAQTWIEENLAISRAIGDRPAYGWALQSLVRCFIFLGEFERAGNLLDQLRAFVEETPYRNQPENFHMLRGDFALLQGEFDAAERAYWKSLATAQDPFYRGWSYRGLGSIARFRGDWEQAKAHLYNAIAIAESTDEKWNHGLTYIMLGDVSHELGDSAAEWRHLAASAALLEPLGDKWGIARWCESCARFALTLDDFVWAAHLQGAADALRTAGGSKRAVVERARNNSLRSTLEARLGASALRAALDEGAALAQDTRALVRLVPGHLSHAAAESQAQTGLGQTGLDQTGLGQTDGPQTAQGDAQAAIQEPAQRRTQETHQGNGPVNAHSARLSQHSARQD